jgi:hypothetical protein
MATMRRSALSKCASAWNERKARPCFTQRRKDTQGGNRGKIERGKTAERGQKCERSVRVFDATTRTATTRTLFLLYSFLLTSAFNSRVSGTTMTVMMVIPSCCRPCRQYTNMLSLLLGWYDRTSLNDFLHPSRNNFLSLPHFVCFNVYAKLLTVYNGLYWVDHLAAYN